MSDFPPSTFLLEPDELPSVGGEQSEAFFFRVRKGLLIHLERRIRKPSYTLLASGEPGLLPGAMADTVELVDRFVRILVSHPLREPIAHPG